MSSFVGSGRDNITNSIERYNDNEDNGDDDDQQNQHHHHDHQIFFSIPDPGTIEPLDHKLPKDIGSEGADFTLKCLDKVNW